MSIKDWEIEIFGIEHPPQKVVKIFEHYCPHGRILDAGAGAGHLAPRLREAGYEIIDHSRRYPTGPVPGRENPLHGCRSQHEPSLSRSEVQRGSLRQCN